MHKSIIDTALIGYYCQKMDLAVGCSINSSEFIIKRAAARALLAEIEKVKAELTS